MKLLVAVMLAVLALGQSRAGWAESRSEETTVAQIGYGTGSVIGSAVYFPFKAAFCILGGIGSGVVLVTNGRETANRVVSTTCRGTWAITPDVVKGKEQVHFVGETATSASKATADK